MRTILISAVVISTLVTGAAIESAQAKGCIKGALVGGVAGHTAGHSMLGAIGGCVTGRAIATTARQRARQIQAQRIQAQRIQAQRQQNVGNSGSVRPPGYGPGTTSQGQAYVPRVTPGLGTTQTYAPGTFRQQ